MGLGKYFPSSTIYHYLRKLLILLWLNGFWIKITNERNQVTWAANDIFQGRGGGGNYLNIAREGAKSPPPHLTWNFYREFGRFYV